MVHGLAGRDVAAVVSVTPRGSAAGRPSRALSVEQAQALVIAAKGTRLEAYVLLSLMTGIRTEEARALTWQHVDLYGDPDASPVRAENPVHGSDQQGCLPSRLTVTINGHVPAVRFPPHHAGGRVAAAVPA
jgi:hypothetical protein